MAIPTMNKMTPRLNKPVNDPNNCPNIIPPLTLQNHLITSTKRVIDLTQKLSKF